jgi:hypothetical protein
MSRSVRWGVFSIGNEQPRLLRLNVDLGERLGDLALVENGKACSPRDSIVPRGGLRRCRALARQTEPGLRVAAVEFG